MIAIFSDIHGNLPALTSVLADAEQRGATRYWCLGDTVGYGPFVNECLALVADSCEVILSGNHEVVVKGDAPGVRFGGTAGAGVEYARDHMNERSWKLVESLNTSEVFEEIELYHGSAVDPTWEYVNDIDSATAHLDVQRAPMSIVGHSHMQVAFWRGINEPVGTKAQGGTVVDGQELLLHDRRMVFNPGSVGQPRDGDHRAAYALLAPGRVSFHRVEYDIEAMSKAVYDADLPGATAQRLRDGH